MPPPGAPTLYRRTIDLYELAFAGFRPREFTGAVCQFVVLPDDTEPVAFHLIAGRDDLVYRQGVHPHPVARVTLPERTLGGILDGSTQPPLDLSDPHLAGAIQVEGDRAFAGRIASLIRAPNPHHRERYNRAAEVDRALGPCEISRIETPTELQVIECLGSGRPLIATGCLEHWECLGWDFSEIQRRFGNIDFASSERNPNERVTLGEFIDRVQAREDAYSAGFPLPEPLAEFFQFPFFDGQLGKANLWIGWRDPGEELTYLHRDPSFILHAQILGAKDWWLFPPSEAPHLYPYEAFNGFQRCWVDPKQPDFEKYPAFRAAKPQRVTVGPGELLMMPPGWFHGVYANQSPLLSVTRPIARAAEPALFARRPRATAGRPPGSGPAPASRPLSPDVPRAASFPALAELVAPCALDEFIDRYWEAQPLLVARGEPDRFASLLSLDEVDRALTTLDLHPPQLRVFKDGQVVDPVEITTPRGRFDPHRVYRLFEEGCTIILSELDFVVPQLAAFCRRLEAELSHSFQTNVYMTPPGASGFAPHYDTHDVFVLQVAGTKAWRTYHAPIPLPVQSQEWVRGEHHAGEPRATYELTPGDTLYVPRGLMHAARSNDAISLHVTLSLAATTWADVLTRAIARACQGDPAYRRTVPFGFARPDFDRAELETTFRTLLERFARRPEFEATLASVVDDFIATRHPLVQGQLAALRSLGAVVPDTLVERRPDLVHRFDSSDAEFALLVNGVRIPLPKTVEELVRFALATPRFRAVDMPGPLGPKSKLAVVHRLIREGVLVPQS